MSLAGIGSGLWDQHGAPAGRLGLGSICSTSASDIVVAVTAIVPAVTSATSRRKLGEVGLRRDGALPTALKAEVGRTQCY